MLKTDFTENNAGSFLYRNQRLDELESEQERPSCEDDQFVLILKSHFAEQLFVTKTEL